MSAAIQQLQHDPVPPHSISAERSVIGGLLQGANWADVADVVKPGDFYRPDHQVSFEAITTLATCGKPCDVVTVPEQLERSGKLEEAGGLAYLSQIARDTPNAANVRAYAEIVAEHSRRRRLLALGSRIEEAIADGASSLQIAQGLKPVLEHFDEIAAGRPKRRSLSWGDLAGLTPPERDWVIRHWLGMGHVTYFGGGGGMGKTGLAQAMLSCIALQREYLDWIEKPRTVLMWAAEDDEAELWRRQVAIAQWLDVPLADFAGRLNLYSYDGEDVELAGLLDQRRLIETPMLETLRQQIGDHKAEVVVLDNSARVYGGNENDRHQVHTFIAMLNAVAKPTGAAVALLAHPGKAIGSEYSGSTAWEGAVRARLYLGRNLPNDDGGSGAEVDGDDTVRYLARRKANYSAKDWRRIHYRAGVMVPEVGPDAAVSSAKPGPEYARDVVTRAVRRLAELSEYGTTSLSSSNYLPKLAQRYQLLDRLTLKEFSAAMSALQKDGGLTKAVVGFYSNRTKREGLVVPGMTVPGST